MDVQSLGSIHYDDTPSSSITDGTWGLLESDDAGQPVGKRWLPWDCSLTFIANSATLHETTVIRAPHASDTDTLSRREIGRRRIQAELTQPEDERAEYSFLGSDNPILDFTLEIHECDKTEDVACVAYGFPARTHEIDFVVGHSSDRLCIVALVTKDRFDEYASSIRQDNMGIFSVRLSEVSGAYAHWTPSIRASKIKLLAKGQTQQVQGDREGPHAAPRLGRVGEATINLVNTSTDPTCIAATGAQGESRQQKTRNSLPSTLPSPPAAPQFVSWIMVALLALILLK